LIDFINELI